jgi:WD40 repeat protein
MIVADPAMREQRTRTFRVFVSSTFSDLALEREALQERVFPALRTLCEQRGCRFQAIDLRWGVAEEAGLDQRTIRICLEELRRCQRTTPRPNFIVLLGERYGWRPLPPDVEAAEFSRVLHCTGDAEAEELRRWYRRDDNAVPPHWRLQPRTAQYADANRWQQIEARLRAILAAAAHRAGIAGDALIKYETSATHQEILEGALKADRPGDHVYAFLRTVAGMPADARARDFLDLNEDGTVNADAREQLRRLRDELRQRLGPNVSEYVSNWQGNGIEASHLDELCSRVYERLSAVIIREIEELEQVDSLDEEISAHRHFAAQRAHAFTGRAEPLAAIAEYIRSGSQSPLVVYGESGCGKSALVAKAAEAVPRQIPGAECLARFIGATPASTDVRALLDGLCRDIDRRYDRNPDKVSGEYKELRTGFIERLDVATSSRPLVIFLDALDQLSEADRARNLVWLPTDLPADVKIVVSTLPGECLSILQSKVQQEQCLNLAPMAREEGATLLGEWLTEAGRTLQATQSGAVLAGFNKNGLPLYLKLAFEECRTWPSWQQVADLPPDVPGLIRALFDRLSLPAHHGAVLVSRALGYLAASRKGLTEDELLDLLARDSAVMEDFKARSPKSPPVSRLPVIVWSRLFSDLEPYLMQRRADGASLLSFYHRQIATGATDEFLGARVTRLRHAALAEYFAPPKDERPTRRALSELAYQQTYAGMWAALVKTLTDLAFIEAKCKADATYDLVGDYNTASEPSIPSSVRSKIEPFARFVKAHAHVLARRPALALQQAANEPDSTSPQKAARDKLRGAAAGQQWLRWMNKPAMPSPCVMVLAGHEGDVNGCGVSPDGKLLASAGRDQVIHVWDTATGTELRVMSGHRTPVATCAYSPDGKYVASGGYDGSLKLWDPATGAELKSFAGHTKLIELCAFSADARRLLSAGNDNTIRIWDVVTRAELGRLDMGDTTAMACAFSSDGKCIAAGNQAGYVSLYDAFTFRRLKRFRAHRAEVKSCLFSSDGEWLFTTSEDKTFKRWPADGAGQPLEFVGHSADVWAVCMDPKRGLIISGSGDKTVRLWDETGTTIGVLAGHTDAVLSCALIPDTHRIVTSSWDETLRIWDVSPGTLKALAPAAAGKRTPSPDKSIWMSCAYSPDGSRLIAGSENDLRLWSTRTGALEHVFPKHRDYVRNAEFSGDGRFAISSAGHRLYLWNVRKRSGVEVPIGHKELINACYVNRDGSAILSCSDDGTLRLWRGRAGADARRIVTRQKEGLAACAPGPGWQWVAVGNTVGQIEIVGLRDGKPRMPTLDAHPGTMITAMSMSPRGDLLATGDMDSVVKLWDVHRLSEPKELKGHTGSILQCAFAPDGRTLASISRDWTMKIWDCETGAVIRTIEGHATAFQKVGYSPDGRRIVSGSYDGTLRLWNVATGSEIAMISGFRDSAMTSAFSADGELFVSASHARSLIVRTGPDPSSVVRLHGHKAEVTACRFSADGVRILSSSRDGTLRLWDAPSRRALAVLRGHEGPVESCCFMSSRSLVLSGSRDGSVRSWNTKTRAPVATLHRHKDWVTRVTCSPDERLIASCAVDGTVIVSDGRNAPQWQFKHTDAVHACIFSPSGSQLLTGCGDGTLTLWDLVTGEARQRLPHEYDAGVRAATLNSDGTQAASVAADGAVYIWDLRSGECLLQGKHDKWANCCAFSADGAWLTSGGRDAFVKLWHVGARTISGEFWVGAPVRSIQWHPREAYFAVGDERGGIHFVTLEGPKSSAMGSRADAP